MVGRSPGCRSNSSDLYKPAFATLWGIAKDYFEEATEAQQRLAHRVKPPKRRLALPGETHQKETPRVTCHVSHDVSHGAGKTCRRTRRPVFRLLQVLLDQLFPRQRHLLLALQLLLFRRKASSGAAPLFVVERKNPVRAARCSCGLLPMSWLSEAPENRVVFH